MKLPGFHKLRLGNYRNLGLGNSNVRDGFQLADLIRILEFGSIVLFGRCGIAFFSGPFSGTSVHHGG